MDDVLRFYSDFTQDYHRIFADWQKSVVRQGKSVAALIRGALPDAMTVLDCTCGIGTQALGLAAEGFIVTATDISPEQAARAEVEAVNFGVSMTIGVADIRNLADEVAGQFDVVLSMDNSWAHLPTTDDLRQAALGMASKVRPGGIVIVSIRDYDDYLQNKPRFVDPTIYDSEQGRRVIFQVWDWTDGAYQMNQFILDDESQTWRVKHLTARFHAWQRHHIAQAIESAELVDLRWYTPTESKFYQPIIIARSPLPV